MEIKIDNLTSPEIAELIGDHLSNMALHSPKESRHALNLDGLRQRSITFYSAWDDNQLMGCGALKELDPLHGEIKSMKTSIDHLRKGVARGILQHIIGEAKNRGYERLSLETGSMEAFIPARTLYSQFGFQICGPFADYKEDPHSVFMTMDL